MKNLLYTFLVFGLFFSCYENKENDLDKANLNGEVKSIYTTSFEAIEKFGEIEKGDKRWQKSYESDNKSIYNDNGNRIEDNKYDKDGELTNKWKGKYDVNENLIEGKYYDEDGELSFKWKFKYDDNGNLIESNGYDKDGELTSKYKSKYDVNGNLIESIRYDEDGELRIKLKFKYDDNGNQIEEKNYDEDGELENKYIYEYKFDDKENWIQKTIFKDDKPTFIIEREIKYYD